MLGRIVVVKSKFSRNDIWDCLIKTRPGFIGQIIKEPNGQTGKKRVLEVQATNGAIHHVRACDCKEFLSYNGWNNNE